MPINQPQAGSQPFWGQASGSVPEPTSQANPNHYDANGRIDPATEDPNYNPWDKAKIGQDTVPGIVRIELKKEMQRQKKKAIGNHGATVTLLGYDLAEVIMSIRMWTAPQFTAYQDIVQKLQHQLWLATQANNGQNGLIITPDTVNPSTNGLGLTYVPGTVEATGPTAAAVQVYHPSLAMFGITQLYVRQLVPPMPSQPVGCMEARIIFEEFRIPIQGNAATISGSKKSLASKKTAYSESTQVQPPHAPGSAAVAPGQGNN